MQNVNHTNRPRTHERKPIHLRQQQHYHALINGYVREFMHNDSCICMSMQITQPALRTMSTITIFDILVFAEKLCAKMFSAIPHRIKIDEPEEKYLMIFE